MQKRKNAGGTPYFICPEHFPDCKCRIIQAKRKKKNTFIHLLQSRDGDKDRDIDKDKEKEKDKEKDKNNIPHEEYERIKLRPIQIEYKKNIRGLDIKCFCNKLAFEIRPNNFICSIDGKGSCAYNLSI